MSGTQNGRSVFMIGTDPAGKGGVASVISVYREGGLFDRYPIRYLASHAEQGGAVKALRAVGAGLGLLANLLLRRVALVHVHSASNASFARKSRYLALARWFGVPTVFHLHGGGFAKFVASDAGVERRVRRTLDGSAAVIALSDSWARFLRGLSPAARIEVIVNPVPLAQAAAGAAPQQGAGVAADAQRVLYLGRASRAKGVFDLVDAVARLRAEGRTVRLAIGGDGDLDALRAHIAAQGIADAVEVLGWVGPDDKRAQFQRSAIFALPSYDEGLPMAMLEAMAQAKAVVVTPVGGIPEAVQDGEHALLVPPGDVPALAGALARLLDDAALRARLGQQARARVIERYAAERVLARVGALYESLGVRPRVAAGSR